MIFVKDVEPSEMEYLLQFIYRGEVDIPSDELERLIEIAKDLGIVGLDAVNTDNGEKKSERRCTNVFTVCEFAYLGSSKKSYLFGL